MNKGSCMHTISICIIAFNAHQYITRCLESIRSQTLLPHEIIFIDDCSSDSTYQDAKKYEEILPQLKVFKLKKNSGVGKSRNIAISKATGDYIWAIDCDDTIPFNAIEIFTKYIKKYNSEVIIGAENILSQTGHPQTIFTPTDEYFNITPIEHPELSIFTSGFHHSMCIRRNFLLNSHIKYGENLVASADGVFLFSLLPKISKCTLIKDIIYNYYMNENSVSRVRTKKFYQDDFYAWSILTTQYNERAELKYSADRSLYRIEEFINIDIYDIQKLDKKDKIYVIKKLLTTFKRKNLCRLMLYNQIKKEKFTVPIKTVFLLLLNLSSLTLLNILIYILIKKDKFPFHHKNSTK